MACGKPLAAGQWWGFCGETDMGQTAPALCTECGGDLKLAPGEWGSSEWESSPRGDTPARKQGGSVKDYTDEAKTLGIAGITSTPPEPDKFGFYQVIHQDILETLAAFGRAAHAAGLEEAAKVLDARATQYGALAQGEPHWEGGRMAEHEATCRDLSEDIRALMSEEANT